MNKLIAVVGMSGSGKSVATDYLEKKGWTKVYFGGVTMDQLKQKGLEINPENEKMMREQLRNDYGMGAYAKLSLPKVVECLKESNTVIDGLYSWNEYIILKEKFGSRLKLLCIVVDKHLRYSRVGQRQIRPLNQDEIKKRDYAEIENIEKGGPIAFADYYILNNGTIADYITRLEEILKEIDGSES